MTGADTVWVAVWGTPRVRRDPPRYHAAHDCHEVPRRPHMRRVTVPTLAAAAIAVGLRPCQKCCEGK